MPTIPSPNRSFIPLMISIQHLYFLALVVAVLLALFLLIRLLLRPTTLLSPCLPINQKHHPSQESNVLKSPWPPANPIAAPESTSLPTPTVRRHSYPHPENTASEELPAPTISHVQSWPRSGSLVQQETMEEINGCKRHVVVFGRRN